MKRLTTAMVAVLALGGATGAMGQTSQIGDATITIPEVLVMVSVTDLAISFTADDFSGGVTASREGDVTVETRGNVQHRVDVTRSGLAGFDLSVVVGGSPLLLDETTPVPALTGLARGERSETVTFRATADLAEHDEGTYTGTITYTVVADS